MIEKTEAHMEITNYREFRNFVERTRTEDDISEKEYEAVVDYILSLFSSYIDI